MNVNLEIFSLHLDPSLFRSMACYRTRGLYATEDWTLVDRKIDTQILRSSLFI